MLSDGKLAVNRPRLRQKGLGAGKEVEVPGDAAMQDQLRLSVRMLDSLMRGVSTRQYRRVIPEMADTRSRGEAPIEKRSRSLP